MYKNIAIVAALALAVGACDQKPRHRQSSYTSANRGYPASGDDHRHTCAVAACR